MQELARPIQPGHDSGSTGQAAGARALGRTLVSDTTEVFTGTPGMPEESPALFPAPATTPATAGSAVAPDRAGSADSGPGKSGQAGDAAAGTRRRAGTKAATMLLPELQRLAQSLGMTGTARMRKGELVAAIEQRQGGGTAGHAASGQAAAAGDHSVQRSVPAGAAHPASLSRTPWNDRHQRSRGWALPQRGVPRQRRHEPAESAQDRPRAALASRS